MNGRDDWARVLLGRPKSVDPKDEPKMLSLVLKPPDLVNKEFECPVCDCPSCEVL